MGDVNWCVLREDGRRGSPMHVVSYGVKAMTVARKCT